MGFVNHHDLNPRLHLITVYLLIMIVGALSLTAMAYPKPNTPSDPRTCFPSSSWDAKQGDRPCVSIRVFEDGSFEYRVTDVNGTPRYGGNVGAKDR